LPLRCTTHSYNLPGVCAQAYASPKVYLVEDSDEVATKLNLCSATLQIPAEWPTEDEWETKAVCACGLIGRTQGRGSGIGRGGRPTGTTGGTSHSKAAILDLAKYVDQECEWRGLAGCKLLTPIQCESSLAAGEKVCVLQSCRCVVDIAYSFGYPQRLRSATQPGYGQCRRAFRRSCSHCAL
jgi:hypothetical protein